MRAVLVRRARPLAPFQRTADACGLGDGTFGSYREATLARLRLPCDEVGEDDAIEGPALVLSDEVFVTRRALRGFLKRARRAGEAARLALPPSRLLELLLPLQDVPLGEGGRAAYDVAYLPAGARSSAREALALPQERWLEPPFREIVVDVPVPHHLLGRGSPTLGFPLTSTVAMRVRHWVHVLRASHVMPQVALLERVEDAPLRSLLRASLALRPTRAAMTRALKARLVFRGRRTFIHPTATVEASVLGDDVSIGAYAYVVGSVLGAGCVVEQRAHVEQSCLGPRTFVSKNSSLSACAAFGDTDVCVNGIQTCVVAERCGLTSWARPLDLVPGGEVVVRDGEALRAVGELPCGVAFGEGVFVGAGVDIAPGRAIPPGVRLVSDPSSTLQRVPEDAEPGTSYVADGTLTPVRHR